MSKLCKDNDLYFEPFTKDIKYFLNMMREEHKTLTEYIRKRYFNRAWTYIFTFIPSEYKRFINILSPDEFIKNNETTLVYMLKQIMPSFITDENYDYLSEFMAYLLEHTKEINCIDRQGNTALMYLMDERFDISFLHIVINNKYLDTNVQNPQGDTVLHVLLRKHRTELTDKKLKLLLEKTNVDFNIFNNEFVSPIILGQHNGYDKSQFIINERVDIITYFNEGVRETSVPFLLYLFKQTVQFQVPFEIFPYYFRYYAVDDTLVMGNEQAEYVLYGDTLYNDEAIDYMKSILDIWYTKLTIVNVQLIGDTGGHANCILFNKYKNEIERYEPHGSSDKYDTFNQVMTGVAERINFTYSFEAYCGFQSSQFGYNIQDRTNMSDYGLCFYYNLLYLHIRLQNPTIELEALDSLLQNKNMYNVMIFYLERLYKLFQTFAELRTLSDFKEIEDFLSKNPLVSYNQFYPMYPYGLIENQIITCGKGSYILRDRMRHKITYTTLRQHRRIKVVPCEVLYEIPEGDFYKSEMSGVSETSATEISEESSETENTDIIQKEEPTVEELSERLEQTSLNKN